MYEADTRTCSEDGLADAPGLTAQAEAQIRLRARAALASDADPAAVERLAALYTGAILSAAAGYANLTDGARSIDDVARRILNRH
ncbi:hypothetical protein [Nocardia vaccinii]|uniref:hypothetical protein n=1 Tax=Nocardia vaccinii TaxID=1822 RepID=UPI000836BD7B|nr:hypothetical protein [Nocardia vaccinii]